MEFLHVTNFLLCLQDVSYNLSQCHGVAAYHSLSPIVDVYLSLSLLVPWSCLLSLTVSPVTLSCYMFLTVPYCCWFSLTVSPSAMELLFVPHSLLYVLAVSLCHFQYHGVSVFILLSPLIAGCLSLFLFCYGIFICL